MEIPQVYHTNPIHKPLVKGIGEEMEECSVSVGILEVSIPLQEMWERLKINVALKKSQPQATL